MTAEDRAGMAVHLSTGDMQKSLHFYRDQCGFELKESWPDAERPQWANMVLGGQSVMLGVTPPDDQLEAMCGGDEAALRFAKRNSDWLRTQRRGVGVMLYIQVDDIDAYAKRLAEHGVELEGEPKTQFYGIRELSLDDPDGYRLVFHTPVTLAGCQSCGMPLADAAPGRMYCAHCTDESGGLRPYEQVFEGTVAGFFMGVQKMERSAAEAAAKEHLGKMPAWAGR